MELARGEGHSTARFDQILKRQEEYCRAIEDAYRSGYASGYSDGYAECERENDTEDDDDEYIGLTD